MGILEAIILGIIQGLTEFLPVSSSGHIELGKWLMNVEVKEEVLFTVVVHFATALSTVVIFRKDIIELIKGVLRLQKNEASMYFLFIVISMVPVGIIGVLFEDVLENFLKESSTALVITVVGCMLFVTGALLFLTDRLKSGDKPINVKRAFIIGISQAIAIMPGISRSGSTISTALLTGMKRENAAKFSFLMVLPVIVGLMLKKMLDIDTSSISFQNDLMPLIAGFIAAFIAGVVACKWMIQLVKKAKLMYFAVYCLVAGLFAIIGVNFF